MSDIVACDVCGGTGYDERTRLTLHKRPCPLGCEVPDPHSRSATGPAPAWLRDAMRRGKAIEEEAERDKAHFRKLESEAAEHVETVICMRTHFTGEPPYVGWEGLGLALRETLDERDRLRADWEAARADYRAVMTEIGVESIADVPDLVQGLRQEIEMLRAMVGEVRPQGGER